MPPCPSNPLLKRHAQTAPKVLTPAQLLDLWLRVQHFRLPFAHAKYKRYTSRIGSRTMVTDMDIEALVVKKGGVLVRSLFPLSECS